MAQFTLAESRWLYRQTFPRDYSSRTAEEWREIRDDLETVLFEDWKADPLRQYHYDEGDTKDKARRRLRKAAKQLDQDQHVGPRPAIRGPVLFIRDLRNREVRISALKARRLELGMTQTQVADLTEISAGHIGSMENGDASIVGNNASKLARALRCSVLDLVGVSRVSFSGEAINIRSKP